LSEVTRKQKITFGDMREMGVAINRLFPNKTNTRILRGPYERLLHTIRPHHIGRTITTIVRNE